MGFTGSRRQKSATTTGRRPPVTICLGLLPLLVLLAACAQQPRSVDEVEQEADQALTQVASSLATARLVLTELGDHRIPAATARMILQDSEESVSKQQEGLSSLQPDPAARTAYDRASSAAGDAADLVTEARIAVVEGESTEFAQLGDRLQATVVEIRRLVSGGIA